MMKSILRKLTPLLLGSVLCLAFSPERSDAPAFGSLLDGAWQVESLRVRKGFTYHNVPTFDASAKPVLRFDASCRELAVAHVNNTVTSLRWTLRQVETMVDTEPFVYRTEFVLNLSAGIEPLYIDPGDEIYVELKNSKLVLRYRKSNCEYKVNLSPLQQ